MFKKILLLFTSVFLLFVFADNTFSQGCNCVTGWLYRAPITIANTNASAYTDLEVRDSVNTAVLIAGGKMKADGSDIRLYDSLCNPISYFIQSGINTTGTIIWAKIPYLPANGTRTIYIYYGNPAATAVSSAVIHFVFLKDLIITHSEGSILYAVQEHQM